MAGEDVIDEVRAALPMELGERLDEVETALRKRAQVFVDDAIRDGARGAASSDGVIRLAPRHVRNVNVIAEEVMTYTGVHWATR